MINKLLPILLILSSLFLTACGNDSSINISSIKSVSPSSAQLPATVNDASLPEASTVQLPTAVQSAIDGKKYTLSQEVKNTLSLMGNEERLAYDLYNAFYKQFPKLKQFKNIATKSEYKHIIAVQRLVRKYNYDENSFTNLDLSPLGYKDTGISDMQPGVYDIQKIQSLYNKLYNKGINSEQDALEVGCIVEVTDINDLDEVIKIAESSKAEDVVAVFDFLRTASFKHYWSFNRGLTKKGITNGCCSVGTVDGVNYCHDEYPNDNTNGYD